MVHRARERVRRPQPRFPVREEERLRLVERFAAAVAVPDGPTLLSLFTEDISFTADGGGKVAAVLNVLHDAGKITRFLMGWAGKVKGQPLLRPTFLNGEPGLLLFIDGQLFSALAFDFAGNQIRGLYHILNPDKLKEIPREL